MKQFCDCQIKCKEDTEDTWTCCAHLASGYCFTCNCKPSGIVEYEDEIYINGVKKTVKIKQMIRPNGERCIDWEEVKSIDFISKKEFTL